MPSSWIWRMSCPRPSLRSRPLRSTSPRWKRRLVEARSAGGAWGDAAGRDACVLDGVEETLPRGGVEEAASAGP